MGLSLELVQGTARHFPFQVQNPDGIIPTGIFLSTDILTASLRAGSNEIPLLTPAATWISATNAQCQVSLQNTDSASLAFGIYYLQAYATRAGSPARTTALLHRGTSLEIIASTSTPRPTYISITDVRTIAPWIDDLQVPDSHMGFDDQVADSNQTMVPVCRPSQRSSQPARDPGFAPRPVGVTTPNGLACTWKPITCRCKTIIQAAFGLWV